MVQHILLWLSMGHYDQVFFNITSSDQLCQYEKGLVRTDKIDANLDTRFGIV